MHCADAVLSGGVRRSACAVICQLDDLDIINSKTNFKVDKFGGFHFSHETKISGNIQKYHSGKVWLNKQVKEDCINEGYRYIELWECEWTKIKKTDELLDKYISNLKKDNPYLINNIF